LTKNRSFTWLIARIHVSYLFFYVLSLFYLLFSCCYTVLTVNPGRTNPRSYTMQKNVFVGNVFLKGDQLISRAGE